MLRFQGDFCLAWHQDVQRVEVKIASQDIPIQALHVADFNVHFLKGEVVV